MKPLKEIEWAGGQALEVLKAKLPDVRDDFFWATYDKWRSETLIPPQRLYSSYCALRTTLVNNVPGDIVECGVFRGGSFCFFLDVAAKFSSTPRQFWAYDTFDGFPDDATDVLIDGSRFTREAWHTEDFYHLFRRNIERTNYPQELIKIIKGSVLDTIPSQKPEKIAFLHMDTDYYEASRHELIHFYDLIASGSVISVDDYGHFEGSRKALNEYLANLDVQPLVIRSDYSGRLVIKL